MDFHVFQILEPRLMMRHYSRHQKESNGMKILFKSLVIKKENIMKKCVMKIFVGKMIRYTLSK